MSDIRFYRIDEIEEKQLRSAVVAARLDGQWLLCRSGGAGAWALPAGPIAPGERAEDAAGRILHTLTGTEDFALRPVAACREGEGSCMLFFAEVRQLSGAAAGQETGLFPYLPEELEEARRCRALFGYVQGWLNMQSGAGELWDLYDENRNPTGRLHRRGEALQPGDFHLVVHVWLKNSRGQFLLTKRSPNKGFPNMWESTGGSALAGDDSLAAALREVREETGLQADPERGSLVMSFRGEEAFVDVWLFRQDFDLEDVVLQEGETCDRMYADAAGIPRLCDEGVFVPYSYLTQLLEQIG